MTEMATNRPAFRYRVFDSFGLPWTSSLSWYWLYILTAVTGLVFAFALGIYLGIWLKSKGKGTRVLALYVILAALAAGLIFVPDQAHVLGDLLVALVVALWIVAAFALRRDVINFYIEREGVAIGISPWLSIFFSVCYINGCLRPEFPVSESGHTGTGVLKL